MGYKNREIEIKLMSRGYKSISRVNDIIEEWIESFFPEWDYLEGNAADLYWPTPAKSSGDFVRLRRSNHRAQITMKSTDREDITNRVEIDLEVDNYSQAKVLMMNVHGEPSASVKKKYHVHFLENDDTTISVYQIFKDSRVFVEVEARTASRVKELVKSLMEFSPICDFCWVNSSVCDIFVEGKEMEVKPVEDFLK